MQRNPKFLVWAVLFEVGLGFLGVLIAWGFDVPLRPRMQLADEHLLRGLAACVPLIVLLVLLMHAGWQPLVQVKREVVAIVGELFAQSSWMELALISLAAGIGEEILFRGALQGGLANWTNPWLALSVVSLLFGLVHALSTAYFVLATLMGFYLGWMAMAYSDLIAPIVTHALYDFVALVLVQQEAKKKT